MSIQELLMSEMTIKQRKPKEETIEKPNVYGYLRISTDSQDINTNKYDIETMANKLGLPAPAFVEETISGTRHYNKRILGRLLLRMKKGDVLICSEASRLGRGIHATEFLSVCKEQGIKVYFTMMPDFDLENKEDLPKANLLIAINSYQAEIERKNTSIRTKVALAEIKRTGFKRDGVTPCQLGRPKDKSLLDIYLNDIKQAIEKDVKLKTLCEKYKVCSGTMTKFLKVKKLGRYKDKN